MLKSHMLSGVSLIVSSSVALGASTPLPVAMPKLPTPVVAPVRPIAAPVKPVIVPKTPVTAVKQVISKAANASSSSNLNRSPSAVHQTDRSKPHLGPITKTTSAGGAPTGKTPTLAAKPVSGGRAAAGGANMVRPVAGASAATIGAAAAAGIGAGALTGTLASRGIAPTAAGAGSSSSVPLDAGRRTVATKSPVLAISGTAGSAEALQASGAVVLASAGVGLAGVTLPAPAGAIAGTTPATKVSTGLTAGVTPSTGPSAANQVTAGSVSTSAGNLSVVSRSATLAPAAMASTGQPAAGTLTVAGPAATATKYANATVINVSGNVVGGAIAVPAPTPVATLSTPAAPIVLTFAVSHITGLDPMATVAKPTVVPLANTIPPGTIGQVSSGMVPVTIEGTTKYINKGDLMMAGAMFDSRGNIVPTTQTTAALQNVLTTQYARLPPSQLQSMLSTRKPGDADYAVLSNLVSLGGYVAKAQQAYGSMSTSDLQQTLGNVKSTTDNGIAQGILVNRYEGQYKSLTSAQMACMSKVCTNLSSADLTAMYGTANLPMKLDGSGKSYPDVTLTKEQSFALNAVNPPPQFLPIVVIPTPPPTKPKNDVFCGHGINMGCLVAGVDATEAPPALHLAATVATTVVLGGALSIGMGGLAAGAAATEIASTAVNTGVVVMSAADGAANTAAAAAQASAMLPGFIAAAALVPTTGASGAAVAGGAGAVIGYLNGI